jgi:hypothetical protein
MCTLPFLECVLYHVPFTHFCCFYFHRCLSCIIVAILRRSFTASTRDNSIGDCPESLQHLLLLFLFSIGVFCIIVAIFEAVLHGIHSRQLHRRLPRVLQHLLLLFLFSRRCLSCIIVAISRRSFKASTRDNSMGDCPESTVQGC